MPFLIIEEEQKRQHTAGTYRAVGFSYIYEQKQEEDYPLMDQPELPEHPPTSSVDIVEGLDDAYQDPPDLALPLTIERVRNAEQMDGWMDGWMDGLMD